MTWAKEIRTPLTEEPGSEAIQCMAPFIKPTINFKATEKAWVTTDRKAM